jgi:hypothetical protein
MRPFGIRNNAIVAVMPVKSESLFDGGIVLYSYDNTFRIGRLAYEELTSFPCRSRGINIPLGRALDRRAYRL